MSRDGLFAQLWGRERRGEPSAPDGQVDTPVDAVEPEPGPQVEVELVKWAPGVVMAGLYEVGECLGAGGMGVVHRVRHVGWGEDLAVKSPRPELWAGTDGIKGFLHEAKVWVDLARAGRYRSLADVLDVSIQMAWGLQAAHEAGVVHQDVKPANVLLTADGTAKITDFGLVRAQARAEARTGIPWQDADGSGMSILVTRRGMTPAYASPEQVAGKPVGWRSDVWSWAVSVLELFAGQVSWRTGSAAGEALDAYLAQGSAVGRAVMPEAVAELLGECFAVDPARRPVWMRVVAERLVSAYEAQLGTPYPRQVGETAEHRPTG